ncbi:MAG TPA: TolC family protein [Methylophilus sp.]|uniref:TolC family protein n=1 Tax=Methylophilus sp. TaxID=29541 RepID=UPI002C133DB3|nr:TolC family protein [Methylophilus sp.]HSH86416.1 TolC family protein [Methylophilus sp.]
MFIPMFETALQRIATTVSLGLWLSTSLPVVSLHAASLTLETAWQLAARSNPELQRQIANQDIPDGDYQDARGLLYYNPVVNMDMRQRSIAQSPGANSRRGEWGAGIAQTFEIAGQQGWRRNAAQLSQQAIALDIAEEYRTLHAQMEEQFVTVLAIQKRMEVEQRILKLIEQNTALSRKRVQAGEDSLLDGNLAVVDTERARNQLSALNEQLVRARAQLAATLQLGEAELPVVSGELMPVANTYTLTDLLEKLTARPGIQSLDVKESAARSRLALQKNLTYPDLTVSLNNSREATIAGDDNITSLGVSLPLPIFRRNGAGIGRATAELMQSEINRTALTRNAKAAIQAAWLRRENIRERISRLDKEVYPRLEENLTLAKLAFENGEIGLPQLLILQRQAVDAQRDIIDAQKDMRLVQIELEYISGWATPVLPTP